MKPEEIIDSQHWLTPSQAAELLNVRRRTLFLWVNKGWLPKPTKIGASVYTAFPRQLIEELRDARVKAHLQ